MAEIVIAGNTSGSVTLVAPSIAGTTTLTLPASSGTVLDDASVGVCRAWVNFNGTGTIAIRASFNVSSITDNGTGNYTVNFTIAMPDGKYMVALGQPTGATGSLDGRQQQLAAVQVGGDYTSSGVQISCFNSVSGANADPLQVNVAIFR